MTTPKKPNLLARLLVSAAKAIEPKALSFEGATYSPNRSMIYTQSPSDFRKEMTTYDRKELVRKTRYLEKNSGFLREYIHTMSLYGVGDGIMPQAATSNQSWNKAAEAYWAQWSQVCDITRRFNLSEIQHLNCRALDRDGEIFALKVRDGQNEPRLQILETHRIGGGDDYSNPMISDGITYDQYGAVVSYGVLQNDGSVRQVPWQQVMHVYDPEQISGSRGFPPMAHAINHLIDGMEMLAFEKKAAKDQSKVSTILKKPGGSADLEDTQVYGDSPNTGESSSVTPQMGITFVADPGEEVVLLESKRPNSTFVGFLDHVNRDAALGGLPYEFVVDPSKIGGAVVRLVVAKAGRVFSHRQKVLIDRFLRPTWAYVIGDAIARGLLPDNPEWDKVTWITPRNITVDAGRDAAQNRKDIEGGYKLLSDEIGEAGGRFQEHYERRAQEYLAIKEISDRTGVPMEALMKYEGQPISGPAAQQQQALQDTQPPSEDPTDDSPDESNPPS